jgi:hypothetical protein
MATTVVVAAADAQTTACVNDVPNPYHMVNDWAHTPRPWAQTNNVFVDPKDNVWVFDRCQDGGCAGSTVAPIWELSPDGKVMKNFGSGYVFPHAVVPDKDGNIWIVDGQAKDGKGNQVVKLSPDGSKVLLTLGKAGATGKGLDEFDQPTSVAIAPNGDIFLARSRPEGKVMVIRTKPGGDPAAVLYDALQAATARHSDYVIIDTAGRLHTKTNLMAELEKMRRTANRIIPGAPHETLLVMDATTGQNGLQQARLFTDAAGVTGIVLTKLDGTAKGGVVVAISRELGVPVRYVGVGEKPGDLLPFNPKDFVDSLFA